MLNFDATTKVKNLQNPVRGVQNQTLRVCDTQREQTQFEHGLKVKKWTKMDSKAFKNSPKLTNIRIG